MCRTVLWLVLVVAQVLPADAIVCQPGEGDVDASTCTACTAGKYGSSVAFTATATPTFPCIACPYGKYTAAVQSTYTGCLDCPAGKYSASSTGASYCSSCQAGQVSKYPGTGATACTTCPAGSYLSSTSSTACTLCPAGTYSSSTGLTSVTQCTSCGVGKFNPVQGRIAAGACIDCLRGTYASVTGSTVCTACPRNQWGSAAGESTCANTCGAGTFSAVEGSTTASNCYAAPSGSYTPASVASGGLAVLPCPLGTFSSAAAATCTVCPVGTSTYQAGGATALLDCHACPSGHYSGEASVVPGSSGTTASPCTACPVGKYKANINAGTLTNVAAGPPIAITLAATASAARAAYVGMAITITGPPDDAALGQTRVITSYTLTTKVALVLPAWTVSPTTSNTYVIRTIYGGTYVTAGAVTGTPTSTTVQLTTALGDTGQAMSTTNDYYTNMYITIVQGTGVGQTRLISSYVYSAGGSTGTVTVSTAWSPTPAANDVYIIYTSDGPCIPCAAGEFSYLGSTVCQSCPSGMVSNSDKSGCIACAAGKYASGGSCIDCAAGKFRSSAYAGYASSVCYDCEKGTFAVSAGKSACDYAPKHTYVSAVGRTYSTACSAGYCTTATGTIRSTGANSDCLDCTTLAGDSRREYVEPDGTDEIPGAGGVAAAAEDDYELR